MSVNVLDQLIALENFTDVLCANLSFILFLLISFYLMLVLIFDLPLCFYGRSMYGVLSLCPVKNGLIKEQYQ